MAKVGRKNLRFSPKKLEVSFESPKYVVKEMLSTDNLTHLKDISVGDILQFKFPSIDTRLGADDRYHALRINVFVNNSFYAFISPRVLERLLKRNITIGELDEHND